MTPAHLSQWMERNGFSGHGGQRRLSNYLGYSEACISRWLSGKSPIPQPAINQIGRHKVEEVPDYEACMAAIPNDPGDIQG